MERENITFNICELLFNMQSTNSNVRGHYRGHHSHAAVELVHINKGMIYCDVNDEVIELYKGETILINSDVIHKLSADRDYDITYIQIVLSDFNASEYDVDSSINEYISRQNTLPYILSKDGELTDIFLSMKGEAEKKQKGYKLYMTGCFYHLAAFMERNGLVTGQKKYSQTAISKIMPVVRHIETNYTLPINLDCLAELIYCDRYALCRYFKKATGGTVIDFLNYIRLKKARELLTKTDMSILDISLESGFSSAQYFNRIFKQNMGCTPGKYRSVHIQLG